ncbi:MAG: TetR/AcrR family transcriptional regulator [Actinomycetota bacterium]
MTEQVTAPKRPPGARKAEILDVAGDLFHRNGFHRVGMDEIGEAAGITGPALYFHFPSKTSLLAAIMERLADELVDVDHVVAEAKRPAEALRRLVVHHVDFALNQRELIAVWIRDERSLPSADQKLLRERQRHYLRRWVHTLLQYNPELDQEEALSVVHGVFNFIASMAFYEPKLDRQRLRELLEHKATACLLEKPRRTRQPEGKE